MAEVTADAPALGRTTKEARLRGPSANEDGRPKTDSGTEGGYRLESLTAESLRLWAKGPSGAWGFSDPITVVAGADTHVSDLVIRAIDPSEAFQGIVVGPDGAPVPKALVIGSAHVQGPISSVRTETDEGGRFTLVAMSDRPHMLNAYDPTKTLRPTMMLSVKPGATDLEIRLETRRFIEVHVVDDATGDPVEKPWVAFEQQRNAPWIGDVPRLEPETLSPGVIRLSVPQDTFQVAASAPGYEHHYGDGPLEPESAPATIEVRLTAQPMLRGRVLAEGEPVEGAWVEVSQRMGPKFPILVQGFRTRLFNGGSGQATTDAEGRFEVPISEQSDFSKGVHVVAGKDGWAVAEQEIDAEPTRDIELVLTVGGAIEGTVLMPDGVSAQGTVVAASNGNGRVLETRVDENGEYRLEHLAPGPWELKHLEESSEMTMSVAQTPHPGQYQGDCEVRLGQTTEYDIDQRGSRTSFEGTLTIDGLPAAGWSAILQPATPWGFERSGPATLLDAKGGFSLTITAEKAQLVLESSADGDHRSLSRDYDLNGQLQTPEVAFLTGSIEGTTEPEVQVSVFHERPDGFRFEATTRSDALGEFSFTGVPEGAANLRRRHLEQGWTGGSPVTVVAGQSSHAKF